MYFFPKKSSASDFLAGAREWLGLLELGPDDGYQRAWDFLYHPPDEHWNIQLMIDSIETYGAPYDEERPENPYFISKAPRVVPIEFYEYKSGPDKGVLEIDLPLNGEISQLTAQVNIVSVRDNFVSVLRDIHIL